MSKLNEICSKIKYNLCKLRTCIFKQIKYIINKCLAGNYKVYSKYPREWGWRIKRNKIKSG